MHRVICMCLTIMDTK